MTATTAPYDMERAVPQPGTAVASAPVPQVSDAGVRAQLVAAQQDKELAAETDQYALHLDTLQAQDALNKLRSKREDLTYGQQGFMQVKGGDVINANRPGGPLLDDYKARFQAATDDTGKDLSPRARQMFNERASTEMTAFKGEIGRHSLQQTEVFNVAVDKDLQTQTLAGAVRYASDPAQLETFAQRAKGSAERLAISRGLPSEGAGIAAASNVYRVGVETLLGTGQNRQALSYFDSVKGKLDGPDQVALAGKLKTVQSDLRGEQAANEELARLGLPTIPSEDTSPGGPRENNIGNVRPSGSLTGFQAFPTFDAGVAGAVGNLRAYPKAFNGGRPMTLAQIGEHWAPRGDGANDPAQWARNVGQTAGIDPNTPIDTNDPATMAKVARGIHAAEWGGASLRQPEDYATGTNMAFGGPRVPGATGAPTAPAFRGDLKAGMEKAAYSVLQRSDLNGQEKAKALALLTKQRMQLTAFQEASTKSLDDEAGSTIAGILAKPDLLKPGTFSGFADRYQALGDGEKAMRFRLLASMESSFKDGLQSATDAQLQMLKQLAPEGLPKQVIEGYISGSTKERTEAAVQGAEAFGQIKKSVETDGVHPTGLIDQAKQAISHYVHAGKPEDARKVSDYMQSALDAERVTGQNPAQAEQAIADLKAHSDQGLADGHQLQVLSMARGMFGRQQQMIAQDPYKAGTSIYPEVGPAPRLDLTSPENAWQTMDIRSNQARQIAALTGKDVIPLANEEVDSFRGALDKGNPEQNGTLLGTLANALPADMVPGVAKALVGKAGGTGISQSYGASMLLKATGNAADADVASEILRGAAIRKARGEEAKAATPSQQAWRGKIQEEIGTGLSRTDARQRAMIEQAIESVYVYRMAQSGKSADGYDDGVLRDSVRAVLGTPVRVNGGQVYPPERGMTSYDIDGALRTITDADVKGLKTLDGTDIPARLIQGGQLQNVGTGRYVVTVKDPRTGTRAEIPDPHSPRSAWVLDLSQYVERARSRPAESDPFVPMGDLR